MAKYWVANNPNSEITDTKAQKVAELSATSATLAELNLSDDMVASVSFTVGSESTEAITVSCQFKDAAGDDMTSARCLRAYLSADSAGQTAASSAGLTVTSGTDGLTQVSVDSNTINMLWLTSEADGDVDVVITDASAGSTTNYLNVVTPDGKIHTSGAITFS
tara:strand:+ start:91 stop:579 length:489 start_codon:yes stop_codon:yes gene_type:complete